jgi:hypothetical protein
MLSQRSRRWGQRGQVVPIVALAFVVLIGATALAVDLSLQTHSRRSLQNVSDAAALAGARELPASVSCTEQVNAATAALNALQANLALPAGWYGSAPNCSSQSVHKSVSNYTFNGSTYNVTVNTPPQLTTNSNLKCGNNPQPTDLCLHYVEVSLHSSATSSNPFSGFLGFGRGTEGAQSVAYHSGFGVKFGFALYANTITAGNGSSGEIVDGNVYANRFIQPQANGRGYFCTDTYANPSGGGNLPGYAFFGSPQAGESYDHRANPGQIDVGSPANVVASVGSCSSLTSGGTVDETGSVGGSPSCPTTIPGVDTSTLTYNSQINACEFKPALGLPDFPAPTHQAPASNNCGVGSFCYVQVPAQATWSNALHLPHLATPLPVLPGLYDVPANCTGHANCIDLTIDVSGGPAALNNITLYLEPGAIVQIQGQNLLTMSPYNPSTFGVTTGNPNDNGVYAIYSPPSGPLAGTTTPSTLTVQGGGSLIQTELLISPTGSLVMPGGTVNQTSNGWIDVAGGQALAYTWNDQSGNHPNTIVTFNAAGAPNEPELLQLVQ